MVVPLDTEDSAKISGKICWGGSLEGIDCGDEVANWLSWNTDRPGLRLIRCTKRQPAEINLYGKYLQQTRGRIQERPYRKPTQNKYATKYYHCLVTSFVANYQNYFSYFIVHNC